MATPLTAQIIQESRTLWVGEIETWMDEGYLANLFVNTGAVVSVKIIRDKNTGLPSGYGFVEFQNHQIAEQVLSNYNGTQIPGTTKLNWGIFGGGTKTNSLQGGVPIAQIQMQQQAAAGGGRTSQQDYSIYVGDLDPHVTDADLLQFFKVKYSTVVGGKVIIDPITKYSKGYGFVKFQNFEESQRAIQECNGQVLKGRHVKTSQSFWKSAQAQDSTSYMPTSSATTMSTGLEQTSQTMLQNPQYYQYYQQMYQGVAPSYQYAQDATVQQYVSTAQPVIQQTQQLYDQTALFQQQVQPGMYPQQQQQSQQQQFQTQQLYGQQQIGANGLTQQYQTQALGQQQIQSTANQVTSLLYPQNSAISLLLDNKHELLKSASDTQNNSTNYNLTNKTFLENNYEFTNCKVSVDLLYYSRK